MLYNSKIVLTVNIILRTERKEISIIYEWAEITSSKTFKVLCKRGHCASTDKWWMWKMTAGWSGKQSKKEKKRNLQRRKTWRKWKMILGGWTSLKITKDCSSWWDARIEKICSTLASIVKHTKITYACIYICIHIHMCSSIMSKGQCSCPSYSPFSLY